MIRWKYLRHCSNVVVQRGAVRFRQPASAGVITRL
jgi:hypothetical protein